MNTDIRLSVGFWAHPKTKKLAKRCGLDGVRSLQVLWLWAAQNKADGRLTGMDEEDIALAADWNGEGLFVDVLIDLGWIDKDTETNEFILHDWEEHNPWQAEASKRSEVARANANARWSKKRAAEEQAQSECNADINANNNTDLCKEDATAMQSHANGNAPFLSSPIQDKGNIKPPLTPQGGKSGGKREPTGNTKAELQERIGVYTESKDLRDSLTAFVEMRNRIHKPLTGQGLNLLLNKLTGMATTSEERKEIVDQSVMNSWQGFFPLDYRQRSTTPQQQPRARPGDFDMAKQKEIFNNVLNKLEAEDAARSA